MDRPKRVSRTFAYGGTVLNIYRDHMVLPDGGEEDYDFIHHNGAAAVIPVMDDGRIIMVRQYRNAIDAYTLELPAGKLDTPDEPTKTAAQRELEEETGYKADPKDVTFLLGLYTTVAFCNEKIDIYVAKNLIKTQQMLDDDEYIDVEIYTLEELIDMVFSGKIVDAKTIAGIMAYKAKLNQN